LIFFFQERWPHGRRFLLVAFLRFDKTSCHFVENRQRALLKTNKVLCRKPAKYFVENRQSTLLKTDKVYNVKENNVKDK